MNEERKRELNKKILKFGCLPILILFVLIVVFSKKTTDSTTYINGLAPVDIYLNMEKQDFKTDKQIGGEYSNLWICTKQYGGIDYKVEVYSSNTDNVESVRATAIIDATKVIDAAKPFLQMVSTVPYKDAKPQEAANWINTYFNKDKADTTIGDAKFTILAPSASVRVLTIEKAK